LFILSDLAALQAILGVDFKFPSLLQQSLIHRSYLNENPDQDLTSNERLEFLGDAVLGLIVADELYGQFPEASEGELTNLRSALVRGETLSRVALSLHLEDYLYLGRGEDETGGRRRARNLSCALEAVIGAVLVDQGFEETRAFVLKILNYELTKLTESDVKADYKSRLQQFIQSEQKVTPVYRTIEEVGPAHSKVFTVEVLAGEDILGRGNGRSKRAAEMEAARQALDGLGRR
jgi:ribonuclease-3